MKKALFPVYSLVAFMTLGVSFALKDVKEQSFYVEKVEADDAISAYYRTVNGNGEDLLNSVSSRIRNGFTQKTYDDLWTGYSNIYKMDNGKMYDIYSDHTNFPVSKKCGNYSSIGDCYNREHTIPKSWWGGATRGQGADAIIVVPSDGKINGQRSNMPYGEVSSGTSYSMPGDPEGNTVGNSSKTSYVSGEVFEPFDDRKGDIARIYFYAATMYKDRGEDAGKVTNWTSGDGAKVFSESGTFGFKNGYLDMLLKWHNEDPVSDNEIKWNSRFEAFQGNRNPYIDHPSWVDLIWGGTYASTNKHAENTKNGTASVSNGSLGGYIDEGGGSTSLSVSPSTATLNVNDTLDLTATLTGGTGTITWYTWSTDGGYVDLSSTTGNTITITGVSPGHVEVYACWGNIDAFATINVVGSGDETEQTLTITYQNCGSNGYVENQTTRINNIDIGYSNISNKYKPNKLQFKNYTGVIYNITPLTYIKSVKISSNDATYNFNGTIAFSATTAKAEENIRVVDGTQTFDVSGLGYRFFSIFAGPAVGYIDSIEVEYFGGEEVVKTLTSIEVLNASTQYYVGDTFAFDGTVKAYFNNGEEEFLDPNNVSSPDMTTEGDKTVTVTVIYEGVTKTYEYTIHVNKRVIHVEEVNFNNIEYQELELEEGQVFNTTLEFVPEDASDKSVYYESDDENIATIDSDGVLTAVSEGETIIYVYLVEDTDIFDWFILTVNKHLEPVIDVTSVTLNQHEKELFVGEDFDLGYEVLPIDATNKNVSWNSNDELIATVENGHVEAVGVGRATITVITEDGHKQDQCVVTVNKVPVPATGISLDKDNVELDLNGKISETLVATITPQDADEQEVVFASSNSAICEVNNGVLTAKSVGNATISATIKDTELVAYCQVNVIDTTPIPATNISLDKESVELDLNGQLTATLVATVTPEDASEKTVIFTSNNPTVCEVNNEGLLTAKTVGSATITARVKDSELTATCEVTVIDTTPEPTIHVTSVSLNQTSAEMYLGEYLQLTATVNPSEADDKRVTWSSSDGRVVQVDENGKVRATGRGTATITVTTVDGGFTATCEITVSRHEEPVNPPTGKLCGGNVITSSVILTLLSATFIAIIMLAKKKHEN